MKLRSRLNALALALCLAGMGTALAEDSGTTLASQTDTMDQLTSTQSMPKVTSKFAADFSGFVGSQENAEAIITGLRNGTTISLDGTTITPPTKPMGYGNTYISMSLAKAQLAQYGITEPTPEQLNAALTGGTITATRIAADGTVLTKTITLDGILTQRASGMGWGQIAKANGFKLGKVISSMKAANKSLLPASSTATSATTPKTAVRPGSEDVNRPSAHAKEKYIASNERITTALSGGGLIYGKRAERADAKLTSLNTYKGGAAHTQGGGVVTAAGANTGTTSKGKFDSAPGHNK